MQPRHALPWFATFVLASCGSTDATRLVEQTISLTPQTLQLAIGATYQFVVTTTPSRPASALRWESSDTSSVRISSTGAALAVKSGVSLIRVWLVDAPAVRDSALVYVNQSGARGGTIHP